MEELCRKILQKRGNFGLRFRKNAYLCIAKKVRGVAQLVSAPRSGRGGRKFESSHPDLFTMYKAVTIFVGCLFLCGKLGQSVIFTYVCTSKKVNNRN